MRRRIRREYTWSSGTWLETNEVHYVYDGNLVIEDRDANNLPLVAHTWGRDLSGSMQGAGGIGGLLARTDLHLMMIRDPGASSYYHADGIGNITALINWNQALVARYLYDPYGNILSQSDTLAAANLYRFSSKEFHVNSGLVYYLYRFYDPPLQRWLNRDPIGEPGFEVMRRRLSSPLAGCENRYLFVHNQPGRFIDTDGLGAIAIPVGGVGGGVIIENPIGAAGCVGAAIGAGLCWAFPNTMTLPGKWIGNWVCSSKLPEFDPNNQSHKDSLKKCLSDWTKFSDAVEGRGQPPPSYGEMMEYLRSYMKAQGISLP